MSDPIACVRFLSVVLIAAVTLHAQTGDLTLRKGSWQISSIGVKRIALTNLADGSLAFNYPVDPSDGLKHSANYLYGGRPAANLSTATSFSITASIVATGAPTFVISWPGDGNTCPGNAEGSPFIYANDGLGEFDRWWSVQPYRFQLDQLIGNVVTLTVPVNPADWISVYGKSGTYDATSAAGWQAAITHVTDLGVTHGGKCFTAHGLAVTGGTAQFVLSRFQVQ